MALDRGAFAALTEGLKMLDITHYENDQIDAMAECDCIGCSAGQIGGAE